MKLEADKSLKIFRVHSTLMGFLSPFIIWKFCVIQHFIYIVLFYPVRVDDNLLKEHLSVFSWILLQANPVCELQRGHRGKYHLMPINLPLWSCFIITVRQRKILRRWAGHLVLYKRKCKPTPGSFQQTSKMLNSVRKLEQNTNSLIFGAWWECWGKGRKSTNICLCASHSALPFRARNRERSVKSHLKSGVPCCYFSSESNLD